MYEHVYVFSTTMQSVTTSKKEPPLHWAEIAVSVDGKAVALVDKAGYLWGGTPDFKVLYVLMLITSLCI